MNTQTPRYIETAKGHSINTILKDSEALAILLLEGSPFALDLHAKADRYGLSHDQLVWAHTLAMKFYNKTIAVKDAKAIPDPSSDNPSSDNPSSSFVYTKIAGYLSSALASGIKRPKLRMIVSETDGTPITTVILTLLEDGCIRITDSKACEYNARFGVEKKVYYGKLTASGRIVNGRSLRGLHEALKALADDPERAAKLYGQLTGSCCFCGRELTDVRSIKVSYGPICAARWGLSWGN